MGARWNFCAAHDHILPIELRDAKFRTAPTDGGPALHELVQSVGNMSL